MLKHRLLMSALLIPSTIALFVWDQHLGNVAPVLFVLVMLLSARCVWEFVALARAAGFQPNFKLCLIGSWAPLVVTWWGYLPSGLNLWGMNHYPEFGELHILDSLATVGSVSIVLMMNAVFRFPLDNNSSSPRPPLGHNIGTLGIELFAVNYVGVLLALTSQLRWVMNGEGYFALGALVIATKMGDVGAYTFGRLIGGAKMTPQLSPGKTWSGGVGHVVTAGACAVAWLCWLGPKVSPSWQAWNILNAAFFGVVVGFTGLVGDLAESLIKRDVGVKDAPVLLPGFGGLLDLMDSLLLAGPVALAMWTWLR